MIKKFDVVYMVPYCGRLWRGREDEGAMVT